MVQSRQGSFKGGSIWESDWWTVELYIRRLDVKIIEACAGCGSC